MKDWYVVVIEHVKAPTSFAARMKAATNIEAMPAEEIRDISDALDGDTIIAINTDLTGLIFPKPYFAHIRPTSKAARIKAARNKVAKEVARERKGQR